MSIAHSWRWGHRWLLGSLLFGLLGLPGFAQAQNPWPEDPPVVVVDDGDGGSDEAVGRTVTPPSKPSIPIEVPKGEVGQPISWLTRTLYWGAALMGGYLLALLIFATVLQRGWTPAGALFFSLFVVGLIATGVLAWQFDPRTYQDGALLPWYRSAAAWQWAMAPLGLFFILGLAIWLSRPTPRSHRGA